MLLPGEAQTDVRRERKPALGFIALHLPVKSKEKNSVFCLNGLKRKVVNLMRVSCLVKITTDRKVVFAAIKYFTNVSFN